MWCEGRWVTMGWLSVSHGFTAEVMARQGFDALCVDMQHGTTDMNDVWPMLQAISQTDTVPVVRVPWNEPATIMKVLDLGAYGIIVPLINTAADAAKAVAACRYPPVGMRSSGPVRAVHYGGADYVAHANDEIVVLAMIETKEGLANGPAASRHVRPNPRDGARARHQGLHALRERGVRRRGGEAWLRSDHAPSDLASMIAGARRQLDDLKAATA